MSLIVYGSYVNDLSEKILVWGKWFILDPECHILSHKSGSAVKIVFQFYTMKEVKRDMEIILMVFSEKNLIVFKSNLVILEQKCYGVLFILNLLSGFLLILLNKRDQEVHENFFSCFLRKNLIWCNLTFLRHFSKFDWVWSKFSQATVTIGS